MMSFRGVALAALIAALPPLAHAEAPASQEPTGEGRGAARRRREGRGAPRRDGYCWKLATANDAS